MLELVRSTQPRLGIVEGDNVLAAINSAERDATEIDDTRYYLIYSNIYLSTIYTYLLAIIFRMDTTTSGDIYSECSQLRYSSIPANWRVSATESKTFSEA